MGRLVKYRHRLPSIFGYKTITVRVLAGWRGSVRLLLLLLLLPPPLSTPQQHQSWNPAHNSLVISWDSLKQTQKSTEVFQSLWL